MKDLRILLVFFEISLVCWKIPACTSQPPSQTVTLDTKDDLNENWNITNCNYFDRSENICSKTQYLDDTHAVGYWANCATHKETQVQQCSVTYSAKSNELKSVELDLRIFAHEKSILIIKTDSVTFSLPINTLGWGGYSFLAGFMNTSTLTIFAGNGSEIIIFDKIMIKTTDYSSTPRVTFPTIFPVESTFSTLRLPESTTNTKDMTNPPMMSQTETIITQTTSSTEAPIQPEILDKISDATANSPWIVDCPYAETLDGLHEMCPNVVGYPKDPLRKIGFWTPCFKKSCIITYTAKTEIEIRNGLANQIQNSQRQISFRGFAALDSHISIKTGVFDYSFIGTGAWMDISFIGGIGATMVVTITAENGPSGVVIFDEIRVKALDELGSTEATSSVTTNNSTESPETTMESTLSTTHDNTTTESAQLTSKEPVGSQGTTNKPTGPADTTPPILSSSSPSDIEYSSTSELINTTDPEFTFPGGDMSDLYLLLILLAVGLVVLLMTLLIIITCIRRLCCKRYNFKTPGDSSKRFGGSQNHDSLSIPITLPAPHITPPPGSNGYGYNDGLILQTTARHLSTFQPVSVHEMPSRISPYKNGEIYFRGSPPIRETENNSLAGDEDSSVSLPRLIRANHFF